MNIWIELLTVMVEVVIQIYFFSSYFKQPLAPSARTGLCMFLYGVTLFLSSYLMQITLIRTLINILLTTICISFLFKKSWLQRLYPLLLFFSAALVADVLCGAIMNHAGVSVDSLLGNGITRLVYNGTSKLMHLTLLYIILTFTNRRYDYSVLLHSLPLMSCLVVSFIVCYRNFLSLSSADSPMSVMLETLALLYINILICAYVENLNRSAVKQQEDALAMQQLEVREKYYEELLERQEETRSLWHDIKKYMAATESLIGQDRLEDAQKCLSDVHAVFTEVQNAVDTGNHTIDSILSYGFKKASAANVAIEVKTWVSKSLDISASDLFIIIGNTMDNAIEACCNLSAQEARTITLNLTQKNHLLYYEISNTYQSRSGKPGKIHGYGLRNVETCVERNGGSMSVSDKNSVFRVSICLNV